MVNLFFLGGGGGGYIVNLSCGLGRVGSNDKTGRAHDP
jgi:hypothetical protein